MIGPAAGGPQSDPLRPLWVTMPGTRRDDQGFHRVGDGIRPPKE